MMSRVFIPLCRPAKGCSLLASRRNFIALVFLVYVTRPIVVVTAAVYDEQSIYSFMSPWKCLDATVSHDGTSDGCLIGTSDGSFSWQKIALSRQYPQLVCRRMRSAPTAGTSQSCAGNFLLAGDQISVPHTCLLSFLHHAGNMSILVYVAMQRGVRSLHFDVIS
jgi:hypothetical protein